MDIVHAGYHVADLLAPNHPVLPRICVMGPLRRQKTAFLKQFLREGSVAHLLDLGGGQGGDCALWCTFPGIRSVVVVDVDRRALGEYGRRIQGSFGGRPLRGGGPDSDPAFVLPDGRRFRLHHGDALSLPDDLGRGADAAVLSFSASQIVKGPQDVGPLIASLCVERGVPRLALVVHDHAYAGAPNPAEGVTSTLLPPSGGLEPCPRFGWCACEGAPHGAPLLETTVAGASMAQRIREHVFDAEVFAAEFRRLVADGHLPSRGSRLRLVRPYPGSPLIGVETHWLLRSLAFLQVTVRS